jgi:hypothetical protein
MALANPPNGLVLIFVSNDGVERFPQYTNSLLRQWDKKSQFLNVCARRRDFVGDINLRGDRTQAGSRCYFNAIVRSRWVRGSPGPETFETFARHAPTPTRRNASPSPLLLWQQWRSNTFILQQAAVPGTGAENID